MPIFDVRCQQGHETEFIGTSARLPEHRCEVCAAPVERVWTPAVSHVRADSIPGGMIVENMGPTPMRFDSHSEHRAAMQRLGLRSQVRHVGEPGSDKSKQTSRWI